MNCFASTQQTSFFEGGKAIRRRLAIRSGEESVLCTTALLHRDFISADFFVGAPSNILRLLRKGYAAAIEDSASVLWYGRINPFAASSTASM